VEVYHHTEVSEIKSMKSIG